MHESSTEYSKSRLETHNDCALYLKKKLNVKRNKFYSQMN